MSCDMEATVLRNLLQKNGSIGGTKLECENRPAMPI